MTPKKPRGGAELEELRKVLPERATALHRQLKGSQEALERGEAPWEGRIEELRDVVNGVTALLAQADEARFSAKRLLEGAGRRLPAGKAVEELRGPLDLIGVAVVDRVGLEIERDRLKKLRAVILEAEKAAREVAATPPPPRPSTPGPAAPGSNVAAEINAVVRATYAISAQARSWMSQLGDSAAEAAAVEEVHAALRGDSAAADSKARLEAILGGLRERAQATAKSGLQALQQQLGLLMGACESEPGLRAVQAGLEELAAETHFHQVDDFVEWQSKRDDLAERLRSLAGAHRSEVADTLRRQLDDMRREVSLIRAFPLSPGDWQTLTGMESVLDQLGTESPNDGPPFERLAKVANLRVARQELLQSAQTARAKALAEVEGLQSGWTRLEEQGGLLGIDIQPPPELSSLVAREAWSEIQGQRVRLDSAKRELVARCLQDREHLRERLARANDVLTRASDALVPVGIGPLSGSVVQLAEVRNLDDCVTAAAENERREIVLREAISAALVQAQARLAEVAAALHTLGAVPLPPPASQRTAAAIARIEALEMAPDVAALDRALDAIQDSERLILEIAPDHGPAALEIERVRRDSVHARSELEGFGKGWLDRVDALVGGAARALPLDFGSARTQIGEARRLLTAFLQHARRLAAARVQADLAFLDRFRSDPAVAALFREVDALDQHRLPPASVRHRLVQMCQLRGAHGN